MAEEFPIDPEFGRFIEGITPTEEGGAIVDLAEEIPEIEELPDGSAVVNFEDQIPSTVIAALGSIRVSMSTAARTANREERALNLMR